MTDGLDRATASLTDGEQVLWSGVPDSSVILSPGDALLIPFSVLWAGFAVFWEYFVLTLRAPVYFPLFGSVFVLIGLYIVFFRFFVGKYRRRTTSYVLTTRRAIVLGPRSLKSARVDRYTFSRSWSRDSRRMTVNFGFPQDQTMRAIFGRSLFSMTGVIGPFTGWDPLNLSYTPLVFQDVLDAEGLEAALAQVEGR